MHTIILAIVLLTSFSGKSQIKLTNGSDKTISKIETVDLSEIGFKNLSMNGSLMVYNGNDETVLSQLVDGNMDGIADQVVFPVEILANSFAEFRFSVSKNLGSDTILNSTYCRFVPERMDDFAWENDKVAFRTYGQTCQKLFEQGNPTGLISSGIDCWFKRVEYPIINQWYKKEENGGSYHKDDGQGLDNFQVGLSRGCGGTAIWHKSEFVFSQNYSEWQIIANGPLRSIFKLKYKPVMVDGKPVTETKTITIDLGDNFYRCDVDFESDLTIDTLAIGLTLHENKGQTGYSADGWISYWEPNGDSEIGMGAWVDSKDMPGFRKFEKMGASMDHIWMFTSLEGNHATYYAGFGWKKAGEFTSEESWKEYIELKVSNLKNPLSLSVK